MSDDSFPPYGDSEPNETNGWVEVDVGALMGSADRPIPFQLFLNRFKSSSPDSELFIHDPLRQMQEDPGELERLQVSGLDLGATPAALHNSTRVTTAVANHSRRLNRIYHYVAAIVGPDGVHLTIYKDADPDPES